MDKQKQSSSKKKEQKEQKMASEGIGALNKDVLQDILSRLSALSFSYAACVSKSWNAVCNRILSRPKILSAFSLNPDRLIATGEVLSKVFSEPIRPHFAIANIANGMDLDQTFHFILARVGPGVPIIVSRVAGIIGRDARTNEVRQVEWDEPFSFYYDELVRPANCAYSGIQLTIGFVPGLKVDIIPLPRSIKEHQAKIVDRFVMDIWNYVATVSDYTAPVGIMMFGGGGFDQKLIMEKLDYAIPMETIIVGDERGQLLYRSGSAFGNNYSDVGTRVAALVFARDRNKPHGIGEIQFHVALSNGVSAIGPRYKAVSVRVNDSLWDTRITARREGQQEILGGQHMLNDLNDDLENRHPHLYVGVTKRRGCSIGSEKPRLITSLIFHRFLGEDEKYLYVDGDGIRTGDYFQFHCSDRNAALTSSNKATVDLRNLKLAWKSKNFFHTIGAADNTDKREAFGGFIFSCRRRGGSFFAPLNVDSSPFLENFPRMPFAGIFSSGEIGRGSTSLTLQESLGESSARCYLHVYSAVYLVLSYSPPPQQP